MWQVGHPANNTLFIFIEMLVGVGKPPPLTNGSEYILLLIQFKMLVNFTSKLREKWFQPFLPDTVAAARPPVRFQGLTYRTASDGWRLVTTE